MRNLSTSTTVDFKVLQVSSPALKHNDPIPVQYTCDGINVSPPIKIDGIPVTAKCLAIITEEVDASPGSRTHYIVWNIPVTHFLKENQLHGVQGTNDFGVRSYRGPCPSSGTHSYHFKVYALNGLLNLATEATKHLLEQTMSDHVIAFGELTATYTAKQVS